MLRVEGADHGIQRILVLKLRHIGDVLLTVPVFRALKETFPGCRLTALVNAGTEATLQNNPLIDEVLPFDRSVKRLGLFERSRREAAFLRDVRQRRFDMTVDLTGGDRPALISFVSGARHRLGWSPKKGFAGKRRLYTRLVRPDSRSHMVLQNLAVVRNAGIDTADLSVDFPVAQEDRDTVDRMLRQEGGEALNRLVHVHPTSRWLFKCWRDDSMAEAILRLLAEDTTVAVTAAPVEQEMNRAAAILNLVRAAKPSHRGLVDLSGKTTLGQLAALSERADLFFGVDSAPMHIAAAVNTPVVALFGPTGACHWGPWNNAAAGAVGDHDFSKAYTCRGGAQRWGRHTVIQRNWPCIPCGRDGCRSSKVSECLTDLAAAEVSDVLLERLREVQG